VISYGIYLWHVTVLRALSQLGFAPSIHGAIQPYIAWPIAVTAITVPIAAASYYLLERPVLSLKRLVGGPVPTTAPQSAPPAAPVPVAPAGQRRL
jgi:peptidoglycan/LPS O-acetylase OafA/YrhL